jgi:hypothetical protein
MKIDWYIIKNDKLEESVDKFIKTMIELKIDILTFEFNDSADRYCITTNYSFEKFEVSETFYG